MEVRVRLLTPHGPLQERAALGLMIGGALLFASTYAVRMSLVLQALGAGTLGFSCFLVWAALRVRGWRAFGLRLSQAELELPIRPLTSRRTRTVAIEDIELVSYAVSGPGARIVLVARDAVFALPFRWFPPEHPAAEIALRIHVRSQLRRAGTEVEDAELAAIEAAMLDGKAYGALVAVPVRGEPEVVATFDSEEERARAQTTYAARGARTIDCRERILALRDALERGLTAPALPVKRE